MTYLQSGQAANDQDFRLRVQACIFGLAQDVVNEATDTPGHPARASLAEAIIRSPEDNVDGFAWLCAANSTIAATVSATPVTNADGTVVGTNVEVGAPDGDLQFVCASFWDTVVGWRDTP